MKAAMKRDPRGHSLRIYAEIFDSPAWAALTATDVTAYLALLRELKGFNNGDLSLPLSRAKTHGIHHPATLARSLRALCAVGLIAITRKGGCTKGGQRLPNLYRVTDRECYAIPKKFLEAMGETNEWKRVTGVEHGRALIAAAEAAAQAAAKLKSQVHRVTDTSSPTEVVKAKTSSPREAWDGIPVHPVNMAKKGKSPYETTSYDGFSPLPEKSSHTSPSSTPLYVAIPVGEIEPTDSAAKPPTNATAAQTLAELWKRMGGRIVPTNMLTAPQAAPGNDRQSVARAAMQDVQDRPARKPTPKPPPLLVAREDGRTVDRSDAQDAPAWGC